MNDQHATDTAFGQTINLCDDARRFLLQRATQRGGAGFTVRGFAPCDATCVDCLAILQAQSPFVLPMPVIQPGPAPRNTNLRKAIRASILATYGPSIEDPEWATEGFAPR